MRGLLSFFTEESNWERYRTGLFVATAQPQLAERVLKDMQNRWPQVSFALVVPRSYTPIVSSGAEIIYLEDIKARPLSWTLKLRERKFDIGVVIFGGLPIFRKPKLWFFSLKVRRSVIYNENGDSFLLDRTHWGTFWQHCAWRLQTRSLVQRAVKQPFFVPFGLLYLIGRTSWLVVRARLIGRRVHVKESNAA